MLLGNGDGTFAAKVDFATNGSPVSVAVADLDGDRLTELVTANYSSDAINVLEGNGDGTFRGPGVHGTGSRPSSVAITDLNGDGWLDLAVANTGSGTVSVLLGSVVCF